MIFQCAFYGFGGIKCKGWERTRLNVLHNFHFIRSFVLDFSSLSPSLPWKLQLFIHVCSRNLFEKFPFLLSRETNKLMKRTKMPYIAQRKKYLSWFSFNSNKMMRHMELKLNWFNQCRMRKVSFLVFEQSKKTFSVDMKTCMRVPWKWSDMLRHYFRIMSRVFKATTRKLWKLRSEIYL